MTDNVTKNKPRKLNSSIPLVDLGAQYSTIKKEVDAAIHDIIDRTAFILGDTVKKFEGEFADYCHTKHAIGVANGTESITLALKALGIGPGDEVITAANTFIGSSEPITQVGAKAVFCDVDPDTYNIDPSKLENAITDRTRAIIAVHLYGKPAPIDEIQDIIKDKGIYLVEDAAQAHGAEINGKRIGSLGDVGCFSFYPGKNLGAYGDGGCVVTNSDELADRVRMLRNHGRHNKYEHEIEGFNSRLDALQAAVLSVKLSYLDGWNDARRKIASKYDELLKDLPITLPCGSESEKSVYHLYVIRTKERDALRELLKENGVSSGIHYPLPLHLQPAYKYLGYQVGDFPVSEEVAKEILSLPMYPELEESEVITICNIIASYYL